MKFFHMLAATGFAVAAIGASAAQAQPARVVTVKTVHTKVVTSHRRGWHARRCHTEWRHHHRVRVCR